MEKKSPKLRILVVDDEPLIRWSVAETLAECGHEVVEAADGRAARGAICESARRFDVVVLDYRLPDSEDLSLLACIRTQAPDTRVILMTAFGTPEVVQGALDLGAYRVLAKPFDMHDLADLVAEAA
jgi:DNA-binding NtrC family response regulator